MIDLENDYLRLAFDPTIGASIANLDVQLANGWTPLWFPAPDMFSNMGNVACYILAPYSNRIRDGAFEFDGKRIQLAHAEYHAIHGHVRNRPWSIAESTSTKTKLRFDSSRFPEFDFPFPFTIDLTYTLDGPRLTIAMNTRNTGSARMPAGAGLHPYFARTLADPRERVTLQVNCSGEYPTSDLPIPTGPAQPVPAAHDFSQTRPIDVVLDHCFAGWDGRATIHWPGTNLTATIEASPTCGHVIVYSPADRPFFAFEPVTHANDAFNLANRRVKGHGMVVLEPQEELAFSMATTLSGPGLGKR